jgi:hypothetical protein
MRSKAVNLSIFAIFLIIAVSSFSFADDSAADELSAIRSMIENQGFHWQADLNPIVTDYTSEERKQLLGLKLPDNWREIWEAHLDENFVVKRDRDLPAYFNWEDSSIITDVTSQGGCGSCWDFAATAALEAGYALYRGMKLDLSEQAILSCVTPGHGCDGGWMEDAYVHYQYFGSVSEDDMPYQANDMVPCTEEAERALVKINGWTAIPQMRSAIKTAVLTAPVAVAFYVYNDFHYYSGGCYAHSEFTAEVNHAILVVGWDDDMCGGDGAWRCKNSWGWWWGDSGFFWIQYDDCNFGVAAAQLNFDTLLTINDSRQLPNTNICAEYNFQFTASGGVEPYRWVIVDGEVPSGLILENDGLLHGYPDVYGEQSFAVRVEDSNGPTKIFFKYFDLSIGQSLPGDADCSGEHNIFDVTFLISFLYLGGPAPISPNGGDCNCSGTCDIFDITYLISYLYKGGPPPCEE